LHNAPLPFCFFFKRFASRGIHVGSNTLADLQIQKPSQKNDTQTQKNFIWFEDRKQKIATWHQKIDSG